ncbi:MAG: hypothetical protein DU481_13265 [Nitrosomonas sp.]
MYLKTKSDKKVYLPTPEEDAVITAAAMSDPDALPLTDAEFAKLKRVGRPREVVDAFRATGSGWQTRMDEALMEWIREHRS